MCLWIMEEKQQKETDARKGEQGKDKKKENQNEDLDRVHEL